MTAPSDINPGTIYPGTPGPQFSTQESTGHSLSGSALAQRGIIDSSREGEYTRKLLTWKTPHLGYVQMYINPQSIVINEAKDISATRTKAGFILQYAGEKLTKISISGMTGTAGMEGINILEQIYRSEQLAFDPIAQALERQVGGAELLSLFSGEASSDDTFFDDFLHNSSVNSALDMFEQPFPNLASLAANVEMFFQGVTYKGYFDSFRVTETGASPGIFEYVLEFTAYAKQGVRRNFMPWHKQPTHPADSNGASNLSFYKSVDTTNELAGEERALPEAGQREILGEVFTINRAGRDTNIALGKNGDRLNVIDLNETESDESNFIIPEG